MIRRLIVLIAAILLMLALDSLGVTAHTGGPSPIVVAAIGFVVLASFTIGLGAKALSMPSVTGYIATGLVLGPGITGFFSADVVKDMTFFNSTALSLIAISAGLELDAASVRRVARTIVLTVALKVPLVLLFVGGTVAVAWFAFTIPGIATSSHAVIFGLVFWMLSLATSSAVPIAVIAEMRSKGRYTDLAMMMPVVKDVVVVTGLAILIPIAQSVTTGGALDLDLLKKLVVEFALSIASGGLLGLLLILYVRYVGRELLVMTVVMLLSVSELIRIFHLELIMLFITAGAVVRNFSTYEHELFVPIRKIALPVFVVFFTTAGANVDIDATRNVLPLAAALGVARAIAYYLANRTGARLGGESLAVQRWGSLGYLPQSAVNIALTLLAARGIPALRDPILSLGFATIALHLIVGPVLLGISLRKSGEVPGSKPTPDWDAPTDAATQVRGNSGRSHEPETAAFLDPDVRALSTQLTRALRTFTDGEAIAMAREAEAVRALARSPEDPGSWVLVRALLLDDAPARIQSVLEAAIRDVQRTPSEVTRDFDPTLWEVLRTDGFLTRVRRRISRLAGRLRRPRPRRLALRAAARCTLEPRLVRLALRLQAERMRHRARLLSALGLSLTGDRPKQSAPPERIRDVGAEIEEVSSFATRSFRATSEDGLHLAIEGLDEIISELDGPGLKAGTIRYSRVEHEVAAGRARLVGGGAHWTRAVEAAIDAIAGSVQLVATGDRLRAAAESAVIAPLGLLEAEFVGILDGASEILSELETEARRGPIDEARADHLSHAASGAFDAEIQHALRRSRTRFRKTVQPGNLRTSLNSVVALAPERLRLHSTSIALEATDHPEAIVFGTLELRARLEAVVVEEVGRALFDALQPPIRLMASVPVRLKQAVQIAQYTLDLARQGRFEDEAVRSEAVLRAIERATMETRDIRADATEVFETARASILSTCAGAMAPLWSELRSEPVRRARLSRLTGGLLGLFTRGRARAVASIERLSTQLRRETRELLDSPSVLDRRLRSPGVEFDASAIRRYLDARIPSPESLSLPAVFARAFGLEPLTDRRELVAHREELQLVASELTSSEWRQHQSILLIGARGSGRTTLINMVQLRLTTPRVLRLDEPVGIQSRGIVAALALELGCPEDPRTVASSLQTTRTVVLIDNVESWLPTGPALLPSLDALLTVIAVAGAEVRWLVSISSAALGTLAGLLPLARSFQRTVELVPQHADELQRLILSRERLTGHRFDYSSVEAVLGWLPFVHIGSERYFRALSRLSGGNIRAALSLHLRALTPRDERTFAVKEPPAATLPFLGRLDPEARATLGLLIRHGPADAENVASSLGLGLDRALGVIHQLGLMGLLEPLPGGGPRRRIPLRLEPFVERSLIDAGIVATTRSTAPMGLLGRSGAAKVGS